MKRKLKEEYSDDIKSWAGQFKYDMNKIESETNNTFKTKSIKVSDSGYVYAIVEINGKEYKIYDSTYDSELSTHLEYLIGNYLNFKDVDKALNVKGFRGTVEDIIELINGNTYKENKMTSKQKKLLNKIIKEEVSKILKEKMSGQKRII